MTLRSLVGVGAGVTALLLCGLVGFGEAQVIACQEDTDCPQGSICSQQDTCRELICIDVWQPICGSDDRTYSNRCYARAAHVKVAYSGVCRDKCGGSTGNDCPKSQFCELPEGRCDISKYEGVCVNFPRVCPYLWDPVCGCDDTSYANSCLSRQAGVSISHKGECQTPGKVCKSGSDCARNESCQFRAPSCGDNVTGVCVVRPEICTEEWDPECGCDGITYANTCYRLRAGVSLLHTGVCHQVCGGIVGPVCPEGKVCDLVPGSCNTADAPGVCETVPAICPDLWDPVCGCDGETYANDCERLRAGVAKDHHGPCRGQTVSEPRASRNCYGNCLASCRNQFFSCVDDCREYQPGNQECYDGCAETRDDCNDSCLELCGS